MTCSARQRFLATAAYGIATLALLEGSANAQTAGSPSGALPPVVIDAPKPRSRATVLRPQKVTTAAPARRTRLSRRTPIVASQRVAAQPSPLPSRPIQVTDPNANESATGPVVGYVAKRSATGTKTDTPLLETPQSVSVVTRDQMDAQQAQSLKEALRYTAGVAAENRANFTGYDITYARGFILDRYLDGMRLQGNTGFVTPQADVYGLERVEVLRGPASVLFGQGSPGGIVNQVSKRPLTTTYGEAFVQGGSYNHKSVGFDVNAPLNPDGTVAMRITGLGRDNGNQINFVRDQRFFIAPAVTVRPTESTNWTILGNFQRDPNVGLYNFVPGQGTLLPNINGTVPTSFYSGDPNFNNNKRTQSSITSLFEHRFNENIAIRQNTRYLDTTGTLNQVLPLDISADQATLYRYAQGTKEHIGSLSTDTQAQFDFDTGPFHHRVLAGLDSQDTRFTQRLAQQFATDLSIFPPIYPIQPILNPLYDDTALQSHTFQKQTQVGLYGQDQIKIGGLTVVGGIRRDIAYSDTYDFVAGTYQSQRDRATSGRVGAIYVFDFGLAPYATYATSFTPNIGVDVSSSPFKPTTGELHEVGVKFQPVGFNAFIQASIYDIKQQNVLTADVSNPGFLTQIGEVRSRGFEIEARASLTDSLDVIAAYSFSNPRVTTSGDPQQIGKIPVYVPRHLISAWADYTFREGPLNGFGFGLGARLTGASFADNANTVMVPDFTLVDAAVHYDLGGLDAALKGAKFSLNATNLLDTVHLSQCTVLGTGGGPSPYTNCVYGLRRQVLATLRYRW